MNSYYEKAPSQGGLNGIYETSYKILSSDVNRWLRLRTSVLMRWLQEAAIAHTESIDMGRDKTLDRGLLWVLVMQHAEILRMPVYDEHIRLRTWPGKTMHLFFPRYYEVLSADGREVLVRVSALWMLIDAKTRRFAFPERHGIVVEGITTGTELALPTSPKALPLTEEAHFTVPFSYVDLNGHMNNTRYFDLAEDILPFEKEGKLLDRLTIEYQHEATEGQDLTLRYGIEGRAVYLTGEAGTSVFRLRCDYRS